jgi:beta-galactosidase
LQSRLLSRRTFLQAATAATLTTQLKPSPAQITAPYPENGTLVPDDGWHLWLDEHAEWKNDPLYLPEDVRPGGSGDIAKLAVNPPTGGWQVLTPEVGKEVILPTTVEQHFWGTHGTRPYTPEEYRYAADDPIPQNGAYLGVSWWYRPIDIPASMQGKRIFLHIRGARLRAEVYLNQKLVGYSIMEELPFECDLTRAANPSSENHLAIRITNPFGRYDWVDGLNAQWGAVKLYRSHGFAGLDRGMTISTHDGVRIKNAWVLNELSPTKATVYVEIEHPEPEVIKRIECDIIDPETGKRVWPHVSTIINYSTIEKKNFTTFAVFKNKVQLIFNDPTLWDLENPKLYHLRVVVRTNLGHTDTRTIAFGFRSFTPSGIGTDAIFRLNGHRIKLYSSISWGFWGLNGLFPTPELAEKEVTQAKKLNLNCLNFHRNLAKEEVLRAHDRLGLLRYLEPGAGKLAIGKLPSNVQANSAGIVMEKPTTEADKFAQRFMFVKCVEMVKAYRSHPSVIEYCLQNELGADLKNPDTLAILEAMRAEDPSRCIVLNDGFVAPPRKAAQAWYEPWNAKLHRSDEIEWGDWWSQHQGAGDQWYDEFYKSPTDFIYQSPWKKSSPSSERWKAAPRQTITP